MNVGYEAKDEAILFVSVDLKKAYDSVPRDALWLVREIWVFLKC